MTFAETLALIVGPLLPVATLGIIYGWTRAYFAPPSAGINDGHHRPLVGTILLVVTILLALKVADQGALQAMWIVSTHPLWLFIGLVGFVNLMVHPLATEQRRQASMILSGVALLLWLVIVALYLLNGHDVIVQSFGSLSRTAPINVTVGIAFGFCSLFMFRPHFKNREATIVTLLTIALAMGCLLVVIAG